MNRRSLLTGFAALALSQVLLGCGSRNQATLTINFLEDSIPAQLVQKFRQNLQQSLGLNLMPEPELASLFKQLQAGKTRSVTSSQSTVPSLVTLGDYWLGEAIQQELIQPLNPLQLPHWNQLPSRWKTLVTRDRQGNLTTQGQVWAAPYRWGTTVIAYRKDKFERLGWTPADWGDLWRPQLSRQISLLNQPREVIGLTLKRMGRSYNTQDIQIPGLETELRKLNQQVKLYSSNAYLQPLILGDTWAAVGWSTDVLPTVRQNHLIDFIVPKSGTALWSDLWVQSAAALKDVPQSLINQWIDFWWLPQIASQLSRLSNAASPTSIHRIPDKRPSLFLDQQQLNRSEFLEPLPTATIDQYRNLWLKVRGTA